MKIDLTDDQRQLVIQMADLWIRNKGAAGAGEGLVVINLMQTQPSKPEKVKK